MAELSTDPAFAHQMARHLWHRSGMPRSLAPLPAGVPAAFRCRDASQFGIPGSRLRARDLERPFRGVRLRVEVPPVPDDEPLARDRAARAAILRRASAHALVLPEHAFYVGSTALAAWGLPLIDADAAAAADLDVAALAPHRALRAPGIRSFQVQSSLASVRVREGLRVGSPATVWVLGGRSMSVRDLVVLGDAIVCLPRDERGTLRAEGQLATIEQLATALEAGRRRGADRLREAFSLIRVGSRSPLETDWRIGLAGTDLPEPVLDHEVRDAAGRLLGISDGAFPLYRVAVEIEGDHHRTSTAQWRRDIEKYAAYSAIGWDTVRLTSAHIRADPPSGVAMVRDALLRRGWRP